MANDSARSRGWPDRDRLLDVALLNLIDSEEDSGVDMKLVGKRAVVTGSSRGIGEAIARRLSGEGVVVAVHGLDAEETEGVAASIRADGGSAVAVVGDIGTDAGAKEVAAKAIAALGGTDILVNNVGILTFATWSDVTSQMWADLYNVNVLGAVRMIREIVPTMRTAGWGRVVQISSAEASNPFAIFPHYAATKAALVNLTVSLAKDLNRTGVTANTVTPGIIRTAGVEAFYRQMAAARGWGDVWEEIEQHALHEILDNAVGRFGLPEEVADTVVFICSPRSAYITAADIRVDGGSTGSVN
ncbi:MAG: SDR family NAD(P)-dependent oxidoreductase [Candidatus Limnocylindrales bacterium]